MVSIFFSISTNADSSEKPHSDPTSKVGPSQFGDSVNLSGVVKKHVDTSSKSEAAKDGGSAASVGSSTPVLGSSPKSVPQSRTCLYYTVLMDQRDWRHVVSLQPLLLLN